MTLSQKSIDEFKEIYKKKEGKELCDVEARDMGARLTQFVELVWDPLFVAQQSPHI